MRGPVLLTSSAGGHFDELRFAASPFAETDRHWVVPRTPQTETALADTPASRITWVDPVKSRQLGTAAANLPAAMRLHRRLRPRLVVSTGAAQAVPHLVAAGLLRTPVRYVESVARRDGPSLTGRIAARIPGTELITPAGDWGKNWRTSATVFDQFSVCRTEPPTISRAVVALGTERFGFPRLIDAARVALPASASVTWQTGMTTSEIDGRLLRRWLSPEALRNAMSTADVVISHGGAGLILTALEAGRCPVVLPRTSARHEHVDDHQLDMCEDLARRGLIILVRPDEPLTLAHLASAASTRVVCGDLASVG